MNAVELILIVIGGIILVVGYFLPTKKKGEDTELPQMSEERVKELIDREMGGVKSKVDDIVEETISYAIEKTERAMERLSNEKIMSVNEYSDTVLASINKNHETVIFLYDMLNEKHDGLVKAAGEASNVVRDIEQIMIEAKNVIQDNGGTKEGNEKKQPVKRAKKVTDKKADKSESTIEELQDEARADEVDKEAGNESLKGEVEQQIADDEPGMDTGGGNNNEKILELHKQGKSKTAIAKELGVGVGEVKLVIGLFERV